MPLTPEQLLGFVYERLDGVQQSTSQTREAQLATTRAVRNLADGLSASERRQQGDDRELARLAGAVAALVAKVEAVHEQRNPSTMSAEEIAAAVDFNTLCKARQIVWTRAHPGEIWKRVGEKVSERAGEPRPLPPIPNDLAPVKKRDDTPTGEFKRRDPDRRTRVLAYVGFALAIIFGLLAMAMAWRGL